MAVPRSSALRHLVAGVGVAVVAVASIVVADSPDASGAASRVKLPPGAAKPPAGTGMGTAAAMSRPDCDTSTGAYGHLDFIYKGRGPVCVVEWEDGADNGGATSRGVTRDAITLVVVTPNDVQLAGQAAGVPMNRATGETGRMSDAFLDGLAAFTTDSSGYETWGREIDVKFVESTGSDEASQRADALKVKELKPFAVISALSTGLDTLEATLASEKIVVTGYAASTEKALKQAPYRWGQADSQASAYNAAEMAGKQLVGRKAEFAGDEALRSKSRVFGMVHADGVIDPAVFDDAFAEYKGKTAETFSYQGDGSPLGDKAQAQKDAPLIIQKLKSQGVTSVILFTDIGMTSALLEQATQQEYRPEWVLSGSLYQDVVFLARSQYDQEQWAHAFGLSQFPPPYTDVEEDLESVDWYWGPDKGTYNSVVESWLGWFMNGVHAAGPKLTPKTFQQGLFATPAPRSASEVGLRYGRNAGLPYDEYMTTGTAFAVGWWDSDTVGPSNVYPDRIDKGVFWYLGDGRVFTPGDWPTKPLGFFSEDGAMVSRPTRPYVRVVNECTGCPSNGGPGTPSNGAA